MLTLGNLTDPAPGQDPAFKVPPEALLRHAVFLGASGSGKTVASKVVIEEMLRAGVPAIVVDPQGDLASLAIPGDPVELAKRGLSDEIAREVVGRSEVLVWTPGSDAGLALGLAPLALGDLPKDPDERAETIGLAARAVVSLVGLDLDKDAGKAAEAACVLCLEDAIARGQEPGGLEGLATLLSEPSLALAQRLDRVSDADARDGLAKKLRRALVGSTGRLFDRGVPLDIGVLLGKDERLLGAPGQKEAYPRTRCSVIYLNSLGSQEEKEFFLAELVRALTRYMLANPSEKPQCVFFVDEIAPFLPPVRKPACRDALRILVKQARKYGVACVFATQNPGDVDYKSLAQVSTWGLGRITQKQDLKKLSSFLKGVAGDQVEAIEQALPVRSVGELLYLAPDVAKGVTSVRTRWLATQHRTLDLDEVKKLTKDDVRARFAALGERMRGALAAKARPPASAVVAGAVAAPAAPTAPTAAEDEEVSTEDAAAPPSDVEALAGRVEKRLLDDVAALTADEVIALFPDAPAARVKRALGVLVERGAVKREKCGRANVHWHPRHAFDLEGRRLRAVLAAEPRILEGDALTRAKAHVRSKLLFFDAETVSGLALRHLPLHRVRVRALRTRGLILRETVKVDATLYLHPIDLRVLQLSSGNALAFFAAPRENAEDVQDLDQVVTSFVKTAPGHVTIPPQLAPTAGAGEVEAALRRKFAVDEVLGIDLVHLPFWEFTLKDTSTGEERAGALDAIFGAPFDPRPAGP